MKSFFFIVLSLLLLFLPAGVVAQTTIKGKITGAKTGEIIIGAVVVVKDQPSKTAISGLDGSFVLPYVGTSPVDIIVSCMGYKTQALSVAGSGDIVVHLEEDMSFIDDVVVVGNTGGRTEVGARTIEMNAMNVMNVVSAKAIELSPDLTVGNVVQRVSGVSVERNASGEGQYAIMRGMDKRYNYTLVDGIKIPSPDNKNRYIPLDIFPSDMLDRLEVTKSLTPRFEGDAVGGVINMVMKTAPDRFTLSGNFAMGYSQMFFDRPFYGFDRGAINYKSPMERHGGDLMYNSTIADFSMKNMDPVKRSFVPNINGGLSIGNRFFKKKLGIMLAGSYQMNHRGSNTLRENVGTPSKTQVGRASSIVDQQISTQQLRLGTIAKIDYAFSENHRIMLNAIYSNLKSVQYRYQTSTNLTIPDPNDYIQEARNRLQYRDQTIINTSLKGTHKFSPKWDLDWTFSYAKAIGQAPDRVNVNISEQRVVNGKIVSRYIMFGNNPPINRIWEHSIDDDLSGYVNGSYAITGSRVNGHISVGGMYRAKERMNYYTEYDLFPAGYKTDPDKRRIDVDDDTRFSDFDLEPYNPKGSASNANSYSASEDIAGAYIEAELKTGKFEFLGGLRSEYTHTFYRATYPSPIASQAVPDRKDDYVDFFPSIAVKFKITPKQNIRASYFHSINRPSYQETIPFVVSGDNYSERGNPDLKRAQIENIDLRYEFFPSPAEQIMAGLFYKRIKDPIEYAMQPLPNRPSDLCFMPGNFGTAINYGAEIDLIKYFRSFGIKANYTFTMSSITQPKNWFEDQEPIMVEQTRPLFGQSKHMFNVTLMYQNPKLGLSAQFSTSYTGERLSNISLFYNNDIWQKGYLQGDFSIDKQFKNGIGIYAKVNNVFDTRQSEYIKSSDLVNEGLLYQNPSSGETFISRESYGQSFIIGIRYKFN